MTLLQLLGRGAGSEAATGRQPGLCSLPILFSLIRAEETFQRVNVTAMDFFPIKRFSADLPPPSLLICILVVNDESLFAQHSPEDLQILF